MALALDLSLCDVWQGVVAAASAADILENGE
jgi:hypothetical protein